jgi:hypothetical protein
MNRIYDISPTTEFEDKPRADKSPRTLTIEGTTDAKFAKRICIDRTDISVARISGRATLECCEQTTRGTVAYPR